MKGELTAYSLGREGARVDVNDDRTEQDEENCRPSLLVTRAECSSKPGAQRGACAPGFACSGSHAQYRHASVRQRVLYIARDGRYRACSCIYMSNGWPS